MTILSPGPQTPAAPQWWFRTLATCVGAIALGSALLTACSVDFHVGPEARAHDVEGEVIVASKIVTPKVAGGLQRDDGDETKSADMIGRATQFWSHQSASVVDTRSLVYAAYRTPNTNPPNGYVFVGGTVRNPQSVLAILSDGGAPSKVDLGSVGNQGVCTESLVASVLVPACGWVDDYSFGYLYPLFPVGGPPTASNTQDLAKQMILVRPDMELWCTATTIAGCR